MTRLVALVGALVLLLLLVSSGPALAHVVHLKDGSKLEGEILEETEAHVVIRTTFDGVRTVERANVQRVDKLKPPLRSQLAFKLDKRKGDAKGLWDVHRWAKRAGFKEELVAILEQIIEAAPKDKRARKLLGHKQVDGEWMSPEEEKRYLMEKEAAEMAAKGLVPHEGRWVTPEEKEALEKGLRKDGDDWVTEEEYNRRRGKVKVDGKWIRLGEDEGRAWAQQVSSETRLRLAYLWGPHFDVATEVKPELGQRVADACEKAWQEAFRVLAPTPDELGSGIEERIQLCLFKKAPAYARFAQWFAKHAKTDELAPGWSRDVRRQPAFYWPHPQRVIASYVFPNTDKTYVSFVNHNVGLILLARYRFNARFPAEWLQEGFAYHLEMVSTGYSDSFSLGSNASSAGGTEAPIWVDTGKWKAGLKQLVAEGQDPPMKRLARKGFDSLGYTDLAKSWSIVDYLIRWDRARFKRFVDLCKVVGPNREAADQEAALKEAYGVGFRQLDKRWRAHVQAGFPDKIG